VFQRAGIEHGDLRLRQSLRGHQRQGQADGASANDGNA
jgi:hypothetical protein